ncbi:MAG TPA: hypothetical protein VGJ20_23525 [Xanthobacteraceae bacterium]
MRTIPSAQDGQPRLFNDDKTAAGRRSIRLFCNRPDLALGLMSSGFSSSVGKTPGVHLRAFEVLLNARSAIAKMAYPGVHTCDDFAMAGLPVQVA